MEKSNLGMLKPTPSPKISRANSEPKKFYFKLKKLETPIEPTLEIDTRKKQYVELNPDEPNLGR